MARMIHMLAGKGFPTGCIYSIDSLKGICSDDVILPFLLENVFKSGEGVPICRAPWGTTGCDGGDRARREDPGG